jgi:type III secretion protein L
VIVPVALKAAKKILGREIETVDTAIVDIVANSLKAVAQHKKFTIYVNRKDLDVLEANRPALKKVLENPEAFSLRERADIQPGGCIIETEGGIINAQLENQWRILEQAFESLLKQAPQAAH